MKATKYAGGAAVVLLGALMASAAQAQVTEHTFRISIAGLAEQANKGWKMAGTCHAE